MDIHVFGYEHCEVSQKKKNNMYMVVILKVQRPQPVGSRVQVNKE